jgi:hypothetical protein
MSLMSRARAIAIAVALIAAPAVASAQGTDVIQQVQLTEKSIEGFIAAQPDMAKIAEKMQATPSDKPDPTISAELEAVAKKHNFKDFAEYDDVAANISIIITGLDPQTGKFTDPVDGIKEEIAEVTNDKAMNEKEKKQRLDELAEAQKVAQRIKFPSNIELVKKYREKIDAVMQ